jgi:hypothetical protein
MAVFTVVAVKEEDTLEYTSLYIMLCIGLKMAE